MRIKHFAILIFLVVIPLSAVSPKAFKLITGYTGIYPNPHLLLVLFLFPVFYFFRIFYITPSRLYLWICGVGLSSIYFISATISLITFQDLLTLYEHHIDILVQSLRMTLTYTVFLPFFLFLRDEYVAIASKIFIYTGLINIILFFYGLLAVYINLPLSEGIKGFILSDIYSMSWTHIGFIPKWRTVFEETQVMATYYFICAVISYALGKKILFFLFAIFSIYLFSKSALIAWAILVSYLLLRKLIKSKLHFVIIYFILALFGTVSLLSFFIIKDFSKFESIEEGAFRYASFHERIFHIIQTLEFISHNPTHFLFGLGPRIYGILINTRYPAVFDINVNAISFFVVFQEVGLLGTIFTLTYVYFLHKELATDKGIKRIGFYSALISYMPQLAWGHSIILLGLTLLVRIKR